MKERDKKTVWIHGIHPVTEALMSGQMIEAIYTCRQKNEHLSEIARIAEKRAVPVKFVEKAFLDGRFRKGHQCVAAIITRKPLMSINDLLSIPDERKEEPFFLIVDCLEDPRNFGAMLRVADAAGMHGVIFQSHRSVGITPAVSKSSAGALEHMNLVEVVNIKHAIGRLKERDILIIGAEADASQTFWDIDMKRALAVVVGSEGQGLRRTVREMCDIVACLPMKGRVNSLNVAVATGILSYEVLRQRCSRSHGQESIG